MRHRRNILFRTLLMCALALATQLAAQRPGLAAGECLTKSHSRTDQTGHWHYHIERIHHRKCWHVEATPAIAAAAPVPQDQSRTDVISKPSLFSRLITGLQQTFSTGTPQSNSSDEPPKTTDKIVSKHSRSRKFETIDNASKHRLHVASRHKAQTSVGAAARLSPARRDALFEEFQQFLKSRETDGNSSGPCTTAVR
jgi:hypothetical protein